ncbi:MAG: pyridoxal phosphate-dependent aminotransferase [Dysgonamonadaceae bacterium]|nr:pyridoxal phosphate-dependent aminotransferase [Dysgonamonadaceae bacterium]
MKTKYDFDQIIDRKNTNSVKIDSLQQVFGSDELLSLWVADMDFLSPIEITEALKKRVEHGIFGYVKSDEGYYNSIINWLKKKHNWSVKKDTVTFLPGVVKGIAFAIDVFTDVQDKIIIQPPVYPPFKNITEGLDREIINNPLIFENGQYRMDFDNLREIAKRDCKMLILCNPHNPAGRVWTKEELSELAEICFDNQILVVSDEIHSDLALFNYKHVPFATVSAKAAQNNLTLMAPSKTFNIAGIVSSFAVVENDELRKKYFNYLNARHLGKGNIFAYLATQYAYEYGEDWLDQVLDYIQQNIDYVDNYLQQNIPQIKAIIPEASFLIWLDCRELNLSQKDLENLFIQKAKLALNSGTMFGVEGKGFMRLNVGCPQSTLHKALDNLKKAVNL